MKAIIATPVFPPEIGETSVYAKKFAKELSASSFGEVIVLAYANAFEDIPGVRIYGVKKNKFLLVRLLQYTVKLFFISSGADVIYVCNTLASGLPATIVGALRSIPVVVRFAEDEVSERVLRTETGKDASLKIRVLLALQQWVLKKAHTISAGDTFLDEVLSLSYGISKEKIRVNHTPASQPEFLPVPFENCPHRVLFALTEESKDEKEKLEQIANSLKEEFSDAEVFPIEESHISSAEKWYLIENAGACLFFSWDIETPLYVRALSSGVPIVVFGGEEQAREAITKIMKDAEARGLAISEGNAILAAEYSWQAHLRNFTSLIPHAK